MDILTGKIIGCAIKVHRTLGPGLLENVYEKSMCIELKYNNILYEAQKNIDVYYRKILIGLFKADIIVENSVVLELKSVARHDPVFEAQILSYMKLGNYKTGLLINFNKELLKEGIKRFVL